MKGVLKDRERRITQPDFTRVAWLHNQVLLRPAQMQHIFGVCLHKNAEELHFSAPADGDITVLPIH